MAKFSGPCNFLDVNQGDVAFPALNSADVGPIQTPQFGECLLGNAQFVPPLSDGFAESELRNI
jgi:hypothetical protein